MSPLSAARKFGIDTRNTAFDCACRATRVPTRREARLARKVWKTANKAAQPLSMLNMSKPAKHSSVPYFTGERDKRLFAGWKKRIESGKLG